MELSHLHIAFDDFAGAVAWFKAILQLTPVESSEQAAVFKIGGVDLVIHPEWGQGSTPMTLALKSSDCDSDYRNAIHRGAKSRTPPKDKGASINADIFGPGKLVVEFEQFKPNL